MARTPLDASGWDGPMIEARGVEVTIGGNHILKGADLTLNPGELLAVVGPNGAGKSTLARAVCGLRKPSAGSVKWSGREISTLKGRDMAKLRAFVPQRAQVPNGVSVHDAVSIGRSSHLKPFQSFSKEDREEIEASLARAKMSGFEDRQLSTLSGGEMQRVQIAIGLAQGAPVLIADEPTAQLDLGATAAVSKLLRDLVSDGLGVVLIVHDLALAAAIADRVLVISQGRSIATGTPREVLTPQLISEVWQVEAELIEHDGRSALHVEWLEHQDPSRP